MRLSVISFYTFKITNDEEIQRSSKKITPSLIAMRTAKFI